MSKEALEASNWMPIHLCALPEAHRLDAVKEEDDSEYKNNCDHEETRIDLTAGSVAPTEEADVYDVKKMHLIDVAYVRTVCSKAVEQWHFEGCHGNFMQVTSISVGVVDILWHLQSVKKTRFPTVKKKKEAVDQLSVLVTKSLQVMHLSEVCSQLKKKFKYISNNPAQADWQKAHSQIEAPLAVQWLHPTPQMSMAKLIVSNLSSQIQFSEEEEEENCTDDDEDNIYTEWNLRKGSAAALDVIVAAILALGAIAEAEFLFASDDEGETLERNRWGHWKEEEKLGGGAHQGQSDWGKITGVTDL
ncbi:hypothetical protein PPACK8108_LOCUS10140 [Phakopsora pachyrhizi]|uniref:Uncharacterized protein n=1 Tax=Phakopsora pachyrhizi TaxID=170000 RepID=A0AAV0B028_PHAPC|nr:hypothetical protein PPACK8108_LOCUS10140 [Phakopsora pachyrhizi]